MKIQFNQYVLGVLFLFSLLGCEEDAVDKPISEPTVVIDSFANPASTAGTLTVVTFSGVVTSSGNLAVTRGVVLDTLPGNLLYDSAMVTAPDTTNGGEGVGSFKTKVFKLKPLKKYYYKLYALNWKGISYTPIDSFLSAPTPPKLTVDNATNITNSSASLGGKLTADGGEAISKLGICYGLGKDPDIRDTITQSSFVIYSSDLTVNVPFFGNPTGLISNRIYYVRTFAVNRGGTGYSSTKSFKTLP